MLQAKGGSSANARELTQGNSGWAQEEREMVGRWRSVSCGAGGQCWRFAFYSLRQEGFVQCSIEKSYSCAFEYAFNIS